MKSVGGNKTAKVLVKSVGEKTKRGTRKNGFSEVAVICGFLDKRTTYDKHNVMDKEVEQGSWFFFCDYDATVDGLKEFDTWLNIDGDLYTVTHIDNVMERCEHFEIYLRKVGDQDGSRMG